MRGDTLVSCARPRSRARPFRSLAWGDAISRPLVLPTGAVGSEKARAKKPPVRGLASASSTSIMTITILEDFSMRNYDSAYIRRIERRIV